MELHRGRLIDHIHLRTQDLPAMKRFYKAVLEAVGVPGVAVQPTAIAFGFVVSTVLTMLFGELVPKNLAIARPEASAVSAGQTGTARVQCSRPTSTTTGRAAPSRE